jgi:YVTN family beta-propeller protein
LALAALVLGGCSGGDDGAETTITTSASARAIAEVTPLEGRPSAVTYGEDTLWVADDERNLVLRLDPDDGRVKGNPIPVDPQPVAIDYGAGAIWVAHGGGTLTQIVDGRVAATIPVGGTLVDVAVGVADVVVADIAAGIVRRVDPVSRALGAPIVVPGGVVRLALVGGYVWVTNQENTLALIDTSSSSVAKRVQVGNGPIGLADTDGVVWVANSDDDTVSRIDAQAVALLDHKPVGKAPVAVAGGSGFVFIANQDDETLTTLEAPAGRAVDRPVSLGLRPRDLVTTPAGTWAVGVEPSGAALVRSPR